MRFGEALEMKEEILLRLPSMTGQRGATPPPIGIGLAPSDREGDFRIAVRPRYEHDLTGTALSFLTRTTVGELDIRITGPIAPTGAPLTVGSSMAHPRGRTGTLGFFARRNRDGVLGFVSANHVIAAQDAGVEGDQILHPGPPDRANEGDSTCVGLLAGDYPRLADPGLRIADCAFGRLVDGVAIEPSFIGDGPALRPEPVTPSKHVEVSKIGRTTGRTHGRITALALDDFAINYSFGEVRFKNQIEIESSDASPFSKPGDSGSVVFDGDCRPLALLYARSAAGGASNAGLTFATPINIVLDTLGVTFVA
jgi:hypothetical protein